MKRRTLRILLYLVPIILVIGVAAITWYQRERRVSFLSDAATIRAPLEGAAIRDILWTPPVRLPGILNTAGNEFEPAVSRDGRTLFFVRGRAAHDADIFISTMSVDGWTEPRPLLEINTDADELGPEPAPDGRALYFYSDRAGGLGGYDLWVSSCDDDGVFSPPVNLGPAVNSPDNDYGPCIAPDGDALYFASDRPKPGEAAPADATQVVEGRDYDLYVATRTEDGFAAVAAVSELNSLANDGAPAFSESGDFLYFASDRPSGFGGFDLYRARVAHGEIMAPRNLGDSINTAANEIDPALTLGGFGIHFSSDRPVATPEGDAAASNGLYDLYYAQSREVFTETEAYRARIDWSALLALLLPYLIWLLLTLLTLGALAAVMRRLEYNRMSLLMKCMLGSLIAHLILLMLLTLWGVSTQLSDALTPSNAMRVVLTSPSVGSGIAEQIRGEMTDVEIEAEQEQAAQQLVETEIDQPVNEDAKLAVERTALEEFEPLDAETEMNEAVAAAMDAPTPAPVEPDQPAADIDNALPAEANRERTREAIARVPERAVSNPNATRAEDDALPSPPQTFDTQVALNVERAEALNESAASLAERSSAEDAGAEPSSTLMEVQPREVASSDASDVPLPFAEVQKLAKAREAQAKTAPAPRELNRREQPVADPAAQAAPAEVQLQAPRAPDQLAMQSMARPVQARSASAETALQPVNTADATPQAQAAEVALQAMPQTQAVTAAEQEHQVEVAVAPTGRTDARDAYESAGAPAQQIEVAPDATRLVASDSMANALTMSDAAVETSPMPEMHARVNEPAAAASDLPLTTPSREVETQPTVAEAQPRSAIQPTSVARLQGTNLPEQPQDASAQQVDIRTDTAPLAVVTTTLVHADAADSATDAGVDAPPVLDTAVAAAAADSSAVDVNLPSELAAGPASASEASLPAATSLVSLPSASTSSARSALPTDVDTEATNVEVALNPAGEPVDTAARSMAQVASHDAGTTSDALPQSAARPLQVDDAIAMNLDLPADQAAGESTPSTGVERSLAPLIATTNTSRAASTTTPDAPQDVRETEVAIAPSGAAVDADATSLAQSRASDSAPLATILPRLDASPALPAAATDTFALDLPTERDQPAKPAAVPGRTPTEHVAEQSISKYSPRESLSLESAAAAVMMNPAPAPRESSAHRLVDEVLTSDDGLSPSLSPPLSPREFNEGLVIPPLAAVNVDSLEESGPASSGESSDRLAAVSATGTVRRARLENPPSTSDASTNDVSPSLTTLPPALAPATIRNDRLVAARDSIDRAVGLPGDVALPRLDFQRLDAPAPSPRDLDLKLPLEQLAPLNPYTQRSEDVRETMIETMGGSKETERAVKLALDWLARHQSPDGGWDGDHFDDRCGECGGRAKVQVDIGLTGLSLLCFLAADHTHLKEGPYQDTVRRGLRWLLRKQHAVGSMITDESMYSHGIATIALAEAYGMTGDPELADPVQHAIDFIYSARNRSVGGWRYGPGQVGDTSVLGWQMMALKSADRAGLNVPRDAFDVGRRWLDLVSASAPPGEYRYQPDGEVTPAMTAEGLFVRQLLGGGDDDANTQASVAHILDRLPDWDAECNVYFWYYATLAMFQHRGEAWETWNKAVTAALIPHQHTSGRPAGSWDPEGRWAGIGGRVYQTAVSTLILEVYYRYLPTFVGDTSAPARSAIMGRVTDADTGAALPGAAVRLDLGEDRSVTARADEIGQYTLLVPDVPQFIAVSASHPGYTPETINVAAAEVQRRTVVRDFTLRPERGDVIAVELDPEVHHLGNNEFTGRINSQFQKQSEGLVYATTFELTAAQLPAGNGAAEVRLLVRGAQAPNPILVNDNIVLTRLDKAPRDGSFGEFRARFPVRWLAEGPNTIEIRSVRGDADLDDFEFVNIRVVLNPRVND